MVNIGTYKIPEIQKQYAKLKDELEFIDHQKVVSKAERRIMYQLSAACNGRRNEISYLQAQIQALEGYVDRFNSDNQQEI
jgi:hypothetical protein